VGAAALIAGAALGTSITTQGHASEPSTAPAAAADAYGLFVDVAVTGVAVPTVGPLARATQEAPPTAAAPATFEQLGTGQVPAGTGAVVENVGVLTSTASANLTPVAAATAQAADVALLNQAGTPLITADLVKAQSTTNCTAAPSGGTEIVNLRVAGLPPANPVIPLTPAVNFDLAPQVFAPLGLKVILNEQHPTADGRGLVVNAIHIYQTTPTIVPGLFAGDVIVSHAMSTVHCPNGAGSTSPEQAVMIVKDVDKSTASPGDTLTYTATVQNKLTSACLVNRFIDHLPAPFEHVSTSGAFGTVATTAARPGGGTDVIIEPANMTIAAGASATQTFVVKVKANAAPGVYFNNVELLCGNLGNWVKGLDAPVEVLGAQVATTTTTSTTTTTTMASRELPAELPETGGGWGLGGAALAAGAAAFAALRRRL
jgi:uncharacterized repeat protein (TIGR01451 family)